MVSLVRFPSFFYHAPTNSPPPSLSELSLSLLHLLQALWLYSIAFFQFTEVGRELVPSAMVAAALFGVEAATVVG